MSTPPPRPRRSRRRPSSDPSDATCYRAVGTASSFAAAARRLGLSVYRLRLAADRHAQTRGLPPAEPVPLGRRAYELREQSLRQGEALTWAEIGRRIDHADPILLARSWALSRKNGRPWPISSPSSTSGASHA